MAKSSQSSAWKHCIHSLGDFSALLLEQTLNKPFGIETAWWTAYLRRWRYPPLREFDVFVLWLVGRYSAIFNSHVGKLQKFVHSGSTVPGCWFSVLCLGRKGLWARKRNSGCLRLVLLTLTQLAKNRGRLRLRFEVYEICEESKREQLFALRA